MTTTATNPAARLAWGLNWAVPEDAHAAWGARAIIEGPGFGLLPDRQSVWSDDDAAREKLIAVLNGPNRGDGAIHEAQQKVAALRSAGIICGPNGAGGDKEQEHVLYEDDAVKVMGNTNGSFGYLYVTAWLKPEAT